MHMLSYRRHGEKEVKMEAKQQKINLTSVAERSLTISPLMSGRTKFETEDIINMTLTISKYGFAQLDNASYPVIIFAEFPERYYCGGYVLNKMLSDISDEYEDVPEFREDDGTYNLDDLFEPLRIKLMLDKTRDGKRNITRVELVN